LTENKDKGKAPDYKGEGVAVWVNKDKNGKDYLSISILNNQIRLAAFKQETKDEILTELNRQKKEGLLSDEEYGKKVTDLL
jgi:uncharacterized protein (DUF736 family)